MGIWSKIKETFGSEKQDLQEKWSEEDKGSRMAEKVGQKIGEGIGYVGGKIHEKYQQKYGGGEYREARIKEIQARAREVEAKNRLIKAQSKKGMIKSSKGLSFGFKPNYGVITGQMGRQDISSITGIPERSKKNPYAHLFGVKK